VGSSTLEVTTTIQVEEKRMFY